MNHSLKLLTFVSFILFFATCREPQKTEENRTEPVNRKETAVDKNQLSNTHVAPGGEYSFERPNDFGLAVNRQQILVKTVIPPCPEGFDYCLYYNGKKYENTNFESAGVGFYILKNIGKEACLSVNKYNGRKKNLHVETINGIAFSVFSSGDAGMGHYAEDVVYQTFQNETCYRFIARIGTSQFENYEPGTIKKFTPEMKNEVRQALKTIVKGIHFNQK